MNANTILVKDANANTQTITTVDGTLQYPTPTAGPSVRHVLVDSVSGNGALVTAFHNTDNQSVPNTSFGLFTGGVAQVINFSGYLNRQRETGFDNIPSTGVATGTQQLAGPILATNNTGSAITGNATSAQVITVANTSFVNRGVTQNYQVGTILQVEPGGANQEYVFLTAANSTTVSGTFTKNHSSTVGVQAFAFNQARDATIPDGSTPAGIAASAAYLFNAAANTVEFERSAAGELDGASGTGTNIAAEYEFNYNPPKYSNSTYTAPSGLNYDRSRNVQGAGLYQATLAAGPANNVTSITVAATANLATLTSGQQIIIDYQGANAETNYVATTYTLTSQTIPLQFATTLAHAITANVAWGAHKALGPGLAGFTATGIGLEEDVVYDPISQLFYIELAATNDALSGQNVVVEAPGLYNGSNTTNGTIDRERNNINYSANVVTLASAGAGTTNSADQTNWNGRGISLTVYTPSFGGTSNVQINIQGKDAALGQYYTIFASPQINVAATPIYNMQMYPGVANTTNSYPGVLPRTWRAQITVSGTTPTVNTGIGASIIM